MDEIAPNEALQAFYRRLCTAFSEGDNETARAMFSTNEALLNIGTDPEEWWRGPAGTEILLNQNKELGGISMRPGAPVAFSLGDVGWIADRAHVGLPQGLDLLVRITLVVAMERGAWRIIQWHGSIGEKDEITFGRALTKTIDRIELSVRDERPDIRPASAPDGAVTIAFTDIESSSVLLDRLGDTAFMRVLEWHDRIVRESTGALNGHVVKSQGDGFMLAFPSAAFAVRASLAMRARIGDGFEGLPIRIRVGLHAGETVKHGDDFYGRTVVIAARISTLALGDEILASEVVHALAQKQGGFTFGAPRAAPLKGLEGTFDLYPVLA